MAHEAGWFLALSAVLVVGTFAAVLHPLRARKLPLALLVLGLAMASLALYRMVGTPAALDPLARRAPATVDDAIAQLEARLRQDPAQPDGWRLLGRARAAAGELDAARDAYARAASLARDDADVLVEAAEARAMATPQRRFDARAVQWLRHALEVQPRHQRARWFLGIAQRQQGRPADAASTWEPLLAEVDETTAVPLRAQIDDARRAAGLPPLPSPDASAADAAAPAPSALRVRVRLDPDFAARARLDGRATVFVIARRPGGPPMPVAVERHAVSELPFTAELDDADGPMPTQRLSQLDEVEVLARLSRSGDALPQPGDLASKPVRVRLPADAPVDLVIAPGE